ncbi:MAG TPA: ATP-binding protein [Vicinamibacterales bacterium]|jgi:predicted ATPase|nr:ATP-binding protein [Vicinamibacterales bacterium]
MIACDCTKRHIPRRVVLTGGPGAGKTAALELIRRASFCDHVHILPEAAGIIFGGGFPRRADVLGRKAAQRAIFHVQRELEEAAAVANAAIVLCDRGTVDGAAYWPGPDDYFDAVHTTLEDELERYDAVIHLRTPAVGSGYNHQNPLRTESAVEAAQVDLRILQIWRTHPRRFVIEATPDFLRKAGEVLTLLRAELPECCRHHIVPELDGIDAAISATAA